MAWAMACTAGGCDSPATTSEVPRCAARSLAMAATWSALPSGAVPVTPDTPTAAATARAKASIWLALSGRR